MHPNEVGKPDIMQGTRVAYMIAHIFTGLKWYDGYLKAYILSRSRMIKISIP
jgi:hypothetical protein